MPQPLDIIARLQLNAAQFSSEGGRAAADVVGKMTRAAAEIRQPFASAFAEVQKLAQQSLTLPRTTGGSLDLSSEVAQLEKSAAASDRRAIALRELSTAQSAAAATGRGDAEAMRLEGDAAAVASLNAEKYSGTIRDRITSLKLVQIELDKSRSLTTADAHAMDEVAKHTGNASAAKAMLQHQMRAVTDSFAAGLPVSMIFGEHIGALAEIMSLYGGSAGKSSKETEQASSSIGEAGASALETGKSVGEAAKTMGGFGAKAAAVGEFMAGPWGLALTAGIAILSPFVVKLFEGNNALEEAVDKLKKDAEQTEVTRRAKETYQHTTEGLTAAIREQLDVQQKSIESERTAAETANINARARFNEAQATRDATRTLLEHAIAQEGLSKQAALDQQRYGKGDGRTFAYQQSQGRTVGLQNQLAANQKSTADAAKAYNESRIELGAEQAKTAADPMAKLNKLYDEQARAAKNAARENASLTTSLKSRLDVIQANRNADLKAEQERQSAATRDARQGPVTPFLSPVTGGRVTGRFGEDRPGHQHAGVDYAVPVGTPIRAPASGTVDVAGQRSGYGNAIYINFGGGTSARFGHLSKFNVKPGDVVQAGDVIGYSGGAAGASGSGDSTGAHLHYEVRRNGKAVDPTKRGYQTDSGQASDEAQKIADRAQKASEQAARKREEQEQKYQALIRNTGDAIQLVNGRWDAQPRLIDRAAQDTTKLTEIITDLSKQPVSAEITKLIQNARDAKQVIQNGLSRPFEDYVRSQNQGLAIQQLVLQGRDAEANALQQALRFQEQGVQLDDAHLAQLLRIEQRQKAIADAIEDQRRVVGLYVGTVGDLQQSFDQFLATVEQKPGKAIGGLFSGIVGSFKHLQDSLLSESIFGGLQRKVEEAMRQAIGGGARTPAEILRDEASTAGAELHTRVSDAGDALTELVAVFRSASSAFSTPGTSGAGGSPLSDLVRNDPIKIITTLDESVGRDIAAALGGRRPGDNGNGDDIFVVGKRLTDGSDRIKASATFLGTVVDGLTDNLHKIGINVPKSITDGVKAHLPDVIKGIGFGQLGGSVFSSITGGKQSGLGNSIGGVVGEVAGKALGKTIGSAAGGLLKSIGGAAGPLGAIAGGILGNVIGGLFTKTVKGSAGITTDQFGQLTSAIAKGNDAAATSQASSLATSVSQGLNQIASQLGGKITGKTDVQIGTYDGKFRVNDHGGAIGGVKGSGAISFGTQEQAIAYAIADALKDGVLSGISKASLNILASGQDLSAALSKAMAIEAIPKDLKTMLDPVGAAIDELNRKWQTTVAALKEGGATTDQMAQAQQLYNLQLAQVKTSTDAADASLKTFLKGLKLGSDSPYSLRDQEATAKSQLQPFLDQINSGQSIDQSKYQDAAKAFLDVERQLYGSTQGYFAALDQVQASTNKAISTIDNATPITSSVASPFASATADSTAATATNTGTANDLLSQNSDLLQQLVAQNAALLAKLGGTDYSFIGTSRNFSQAA